MRGVKQGTFDWAGTETVCHCVAEEMQQSVGQGFMWLVSEIQKQNYFVQINAHCSKTLRCY